VHAGIAIGPPPALLSLRLNRSVRVVFRGRGKRSGPGGYPTIPEVRAALRASNGLGPAVAPTYRGHFRERAALLPDLAASWAHTSGTRPNRNPVTRSAAPRGAAREGPATAGPSVFGRCVRRLSSPAGEQLRGLMHAKGTYLDRRRDRWRWAYDCRCDRKPSENLSVCKQLGR
jgi:hypothetical protein